MEEHEVDCHHRSPCFLKFLQKGSEVANVKRHAYKPRFRWPIVLGTIFPFCSIRSRIDGEQTRVYGRTGSQQRTFNAAGNVAHIRSILSEYSPKTRVASENRAFASSVTFVPESAAERNARSHSRSTLHDICQMQTKRMNMKW